MNNKYAYRENDVLVNTDKGIEPREYVDNFDDILKVENNIDILETRIKCSEHTLAGDVALRKDCKIVFNILLSLGVIGVIVLISMGIGTGLIMPALKTAWMIGGLFALAATASYLPIVSLGATKKNIENLKNRISVYKYELEQEEKTLNELKQKSKKIEVPKSDKIITVPTSYQIENLKNKLYIIEKFKIAPNLFIDEYNNRTIEDVLGDLGCTDMIKGTELVKYLIDEYKKQQIEKENVKSKTKSKNKR